MKKVIIAFTCLVVFGSMVTLSAAHVPYLEMKDFSEENPFIIRDSVENSKSLYSWFETPADIDVYTFEVTDPVRLFAVARVPVCPGLEELLPWLAVVGPGLPPPEEVLPFDIPEDYGAVVVENLAPGETRETFYEFFGGKYYYDAPAFDEEISEPGTWYVYYWDPYQIGGDYLAVIGFLEIFSFSDIIRSLLITPLIRFNLELHTRCPQNDIP